jgi:hypothetical protein
MTKFISALVLLIGLCFANNANAQKTDKVEYSISEKFYNKVFEGNIAGLPIVLYLSSKKKKSEGYYDGSDDYDKNNDLEGYYYYEKYKKPIYFEGNINANSVLVLKVSDKTHKEEFKGYINNDASFTGVWTSGKKILNFAVDKVSNGIKCTTEYYSVAHCPKLNKNQEDDWSQCDNEIRTYMKITTGNGIIDNKINDTLNDDYGGYKNKAVVIKEMGQNVFKDGEPNDEIERDFSDLRVVALTKNILCVEEVNGSLLSMMSTVLHTWHNFDLTTGNEIGTDDLFLPNYENTLMKLIDLTADDPTLIEEANFLINDAGITFYSEGGSFRSMHDIHEVFISYNKLKSIINKKGVLKQLFE